MDRGHRRRPRGLARARARHHQGACSTRRLTATRRTTSATPSAPTSSRPRTPTTRPTPVARLRERRRSRRHRAVGLGRLHQRPPALDARRAGRDRRTARTAGRRRRPDRQHPRPGAQPAAGDRQRDQRVRQRPRSRTRLSERFGIDVEQIESLLEDPSTRVDIDELDLGPLGTIDLLGPDVRAKLDGYLGLESHDPFEPLATGEVFRPADFAAYENTTTLARLLLLDGDVARRPPDRPRRQAVRAVRHEHPVDPRSNIMTTTLPGAPGDPTEWLRLIDGDHRWRQDGAPVFAPGGNHGGNGNMPLFESCVLRDMGFRTLFDDWENDDTPGIGNNNGVLDPAEDFPALLDTVSTDPNDPLPATIRARRGNAQGDPVRSRPWVTPATSLTINASDDFWNPNEIKTAITIDGTPTTSVSAGVAFSLGSARRRAGDDRPSAERSVPHGCRHARTASWSTVRRQPSRSRHRWPTRRRTTPTTSFRSRTRQRRRRGRRRHQHVRGAARRRARA